MTVVELNDRQLDVLADRVAAHLADRVITHLASELATATPRLITASEVARRHGMTRSWVYEHADRLGAIRLGHGTKPRLRFDPEHVAAIANQTTNPPEQPTATPPRPRQRHRAGVTQAGAPLLTVKAQAPREHPGYDPLADRAA